MSPDDMAVQGSDAWRMARVGKVTASRFADVLAKGKGISRDKYMWQVLSERLTGKPYSGFRNADMDRGNEQEPFARMAYEAHTGNIVEEVGFIDHLHVPLVGCSPDGLIDDDGGCEFKSALPHIHVQVMVRSTMPPEHKAQVQGCLWVTGRKWWDVGSYCEHMPERLRVHVFRVERDDGYIESLSVEVARFNREVNDMYERLMEVPK